MSTFKYELEERLIGFAAMVLAVFDEFPETLKRSDLGLQITCASSAAALNYAEAQSAETPKEFLARLKVCLQDLRHMHISLRIVKRLSGEEASALDPVIEECNQLIALFAKSVKTKKNNISAEKKEKVEAV